MPKKRDGLLDRQTAPHQRGMRYADHNMIDHAVEPGVLDRYPSVMRLRQKYRRYRIDRPVSRDDADRIINRRQDRVECRVAGRDELLSGRPEPGAVGQDVLQAIGNLASTIGCPQHHHAAEPLWPVSCEIGARQQTTHGMADEMDRAVDAGGEKFDGRMDVLCQRLQSLSAARIVEVQRRESGGLDRGLHPAKRTRCPADSMKQDDAVLYRDFPTRTGCAVTHTPARSTMGNSRAYPPRPCS